MLLTEFTEPELFAIEQALTAVFTCTADSPAGTAMDKIVAHHEFNRGFNGATQ
jgi:hypothetical protein